MIADVIDHIEYRTGIRTDGLTMSIYSSLMVAATPICNSIFSAMLNGSGYNQAADVALGTAAQTASVQTAISVSYIWVETVCYIIGAVILILFWTVEKKPARGAEGYQGTQQEVTRPTRDYDIHKDTQGGKTE